MKIYGMITLGSIIFALSYNWFFAPNQMGMAGLTGLAQVIHFLLPWTRVGIVVALLNIPLFLLGWRLIGGHLLVSSLYSMLISSLAIDCIDLIYVFPPMDTMLACIVGGAFMGVGLGIVFAQGATTGGTDVVARLLMLKFPWLPMGKLILVPDFVVLALVAIVFQSVNSALYGIVALFVSTKVIDKMLYGLDESKVAYIISNDWRTISDAILVRDRGVTILSAQGAYTGEEKRVLMVAFKQREIVDIKRIIHAIDPAAFLIVCDAHDVLGEGFGEYKKEEI